MSNTTDARITAEYKHHLAMLLGVASDIVGPEEAEDVVHDAFLEVMALPELPSGRIGGLLVQRVRWRALDVLRARGEVLEADLGEVEDDGVMRVMQLEDLESVQMHHGSTPPWPSAVDHDNPEDIMSANQMRDKIREYATAACGEAEWGMFCAVTMDGASQVRVAREFRVDQATVSRAVDRVRYEVQRMLQAEGYAV